MPGQARLDACPLPSSGFRIPEFRRIGNSPELAMAGRPLVPFARCHERDRKAQDYLDGCKDG